MLVSSSSKWVLKYILFLAKLKGEGRPVCIGEKHSLILSTISRGGVNVSYYKSVHHPVPTQGNTEHPDNFQTKSVSSPFSWVSRCILFLSKLKWRGESFSRGARRETASWDYPQEYLIVIRDEKVSPFVKFGIIVPLLCFLLDPFTNKHCKAWSSMINLWIYFRTSKVNNPTVNKAKV